MGALDEQEVGEASLAEVECLAGLRDDLRRLRDLGVLELRERRTSVSRCASRASTTPRASRTLAGSSATIARAFARAAAASCVPRSNKGRGIPIVTASDAATRRRTGSNRTCTRPQRGVRNSPSWASVASHPRASASSLLAWRTGRSSIAFCGSGRLAGSGAPASIAAASSPVGEHGAYSVALHAATALASSASARPSCSSSSSVSSSMRPNSSADRSSDRDASSRGPGAGAPPGGSRRRRRASRRHRRACPASRSRRRAVRRGRRPRSRRPRAHAGPRHCGGGRACRSRPARRRRP